MKQELDIVQSIWLILYGHFLLSKSFWLLRHFRQQSNSCSRQPFEYSNFALFYPIIYTPRLSDNRQKAKLASLLLYCSAWPRPIKHPKVETRTPENNRRERTRQLPASAFQDTWQKGGLSGIFLYYFWQIFELCNPINPCPLICETYFCMFSVDPSYTHVI